MIVPTRELGLQVASVIKQLTAGTSGGKRILTMSLLEGSKNKRQRKWAWAEPPHVVVAQPVTLKKILQKGGLRREMVTLVVVDEVDACGDKSSEGGEALHAILSRHLSNSFDEVSVIDGKPWLGEQQQRSELVPHERRQKVLSKRPQQPQRQCVFLSASIPQPRHFIKLCAQRKWTTSKELEWIHVVNAGNAAARTPAQIKHTFRVVESPAKKLGCLRAYLKRELAARRLTRCIVFVNPDRPLAQMAAALERDVAKAISERPQDPLSSIGNQVYSQGGEEGEEGRDSANNLVDDFPDADNDEDNATDKRGQRVGVLNPEAGLVGRASTMQRFRSGEALVLLATDMASRGLDVPETSHVVMFDMPDTPESYLHRAGRTGRMGRGGDVLTLGAATEDFVVQRIGNSLGIDIEIVQ